jgi:hypothetical protein
VIVGDEPFIIVHHGQRRSTVGLADALKQRSDTSASLLDLPERIAPMHLSVRTDVVDCADTSQHRQIGFT